MDLIIIRLQPLGRSGYCQYRVLKRALCVSGLSISGIVQIAPVVIRVEVFG